MRCGHLYFLGICGQKGILTGIPIYSLQRRNDGGLNSAIKTQKGLCQLLDITI